MNCPSYLKTFCKFSTFRLDFQKKSRSQKQFLLLTVGQAILEKKYHCFKKLIFFKYLINLNFFPAVCMEPAVYLATLTTLDFCDSASKPHYSFVLSNRPCPLLSSSFSPMVTTRKAHGMQTR